MRQFIEVNAKIAGEGYQFKIQSVYERDHELLVLVKIDDRNFVSQSGHQYLSDSVVVTTTAANVKLPVKLLILADDQNRNSVDAAFSGQGEVHHVMLQTQEEIERMTANARCLYLARPDGMRALRISRLNNQSLPILQLIADNQTVAVKDGVNPGILNIHSVVDGDAVKVVFETIHEKNAAEKIPDIKAAFERAQERLGKTNISLQHDLFMVADDDLHFKAEAGREVVKYITSAIEFTLPNNNPQLLIDFMRLIDEVVADFNRPTACGARFDYIQLSRQTILSCLNAADISVNSDLIGHHHLVQSEKIILNDFLNMNGTTQCPQSVADMILRDICLCDAVPGNYGDVQQFLAKYYPAFGSDLFKSPASIFEKVYKIQVEKLFDDTSTEDDKLAVIDDLEALLLKDDNLHELSFFVSELNAAAVEQLLKPAYGYFAYNNKPYKGSYTEFGFLRDAKFRMHDDGRLYIIPHESVGYERFYPANTNLRALFEPEIRHLANILQLDFDFDSDFEEEIIFTQESSQKLKAMGLHINLTNLRMQLALQNDRSSSLKWFSLFSKTSDEKRSDRICSCLPERCVIL